MLCEIIEIDVHDVVRNNEFPELYCAHETLGSGKGLPSEPLNEEHPQIERRKGERRQFDLGPPEGKLERRYCPDLRNVAIRPNHNQH